MQIVDAKNDFGDDDYDDYDDDGGGGDDGDDDITGYLANPPTGRLCSQLWNFIKVPLPLSFVISLSSACHHHLHHKQYSHHHHHHQHFHCDENNDHQGRCSTS